MGNYRFKLSDMMPNAWFYKLRDMNSKSRNHNSSTNTIKKKLPTLIQNPRKSYYHTTADKLVCSPKNPKAIDTHFPNPDPPRKSSKKKTKRKTIYKPSPRQTPPVPVWLKPENAHFQDYSDSTDDNLSPPEHDLLESPSYSDCFDINQKSLDQGIPSWSSSCSCKLSSSPTDIIIDMEKTSYNSINIESCSEFNMISEPGPVLPPILTKPSKLLIDDPEKSTQWRNLSTKITRDQNRTNPTRNARRSATSPASRKSISRYGRVKIGGRLSKPAAGAKKAECQSEKKNGLFYSQSFAIVKASFDPEQDFRDSMMEMIVENNIRASKDLEDLLACYLSLNSNQYHELIIKAFEQIWFDMPHR